MKTKLKLLKVFWIDTHSFNTWYRFEDIEKMINLQKKKYIESVGYIIFENKEWLVLAGTISDNPVMEADCNQGIFIPKRCIKKRKQI